VSAGGDTTPVYRVGVISDTHGKLDPRVAAAFVGVERILHAGDIGRREVLWELQLIAPVAAVMGNVDERDMLGEELPGIARLEIGGVCVTLVHERSDAAVAGNPCDVVVFGHSHMPLVQQTDSILWVNPGSASQPRRSKIGRSVAILEIAEGEWPKTRVVPLSEFGERQ
jgi:putative phosphoesterase